MIIKDRNLKYMMILNLILISLLYVDFLLPSNSISDEFLTSETNVSAQTRWKNRDYQNVENVLKFQSGNFFIVARVPDNLGPLKSETVEINMTPIFSKIKSIKGNEKTVYVSVLSIPGILIAFLLAFIITVLNFFSNNTGLEFILSFACVYIYFVSIAYFFYLS